MTSVPHPIILKQNEKVYKVAMSNTYFKDDDYIYFKDNSLIAISSNTGKLSGSKNTQTEIFENMCNGDYFYLSRNNTGVILLGKIIDEKPVKCSYKNYGNDGWIQRSFVLISESIKIGKPDTDKRWAPSGYSTCVDIPEKEIANANELLFIPFFNTIFEYEDEKSTVDSKIPANNSATKHPLNQILFGPPGTGKTFNTINKALEIIGENIKGLPREDIKKKFDQKMKDGQIVFTTFHQSMCYEDFIEGIKPCEMDDDKLLKYEVQPGIFKSLCLSALIPNQLDFDNAYNKLKEKFANVDQILLKTPTGKDFAISLNTNNNLSLHTGPSKIKQGSLTKDNLQKQINGEDVFLSWEGYFKGLIEYLKNEFGYSTEEKNSNRNYVIIIDEINRGNISQIFGELVTLIEEDKRLGNQEALEVTLPYSKEKFGVPNNLYIIGTMNTADRSVEALDAALRRRFSFTEMPPKPQLIADEGNMKDTKGMLDEISLPEILECINNRIEKLLDKDHLIGHSYFMSVTSLSDLKSAFQNKIIPLLQEYFFGDFGKIGLVLGKGFVETINNNNGTVLADFGYEDASEFAERTILKIINLEKMNDDIFKNAINQLLNKK